MIVDPVHRPARVVHCDWSGARTDGPRKRWRTTAELGDDGRYRVDTPEPVGPLDTFFDRLRIPDESVLAGFDFPIGLPSRYAAAAGFDDFRAALPRFGRGCWRDFYRPAEEPGDIALTRPFYPQSQGGTERPHLVEGLGVGGFDDLYRRCDVSPGRPKAASLFWCLGPNQVGKAAITGWRDLIAPALDELEIWPFDGGLATLLEQRGVVVAETYPGEVYRHLDLKIARQGRKGCAADRAKDARTLLDWADENGVSVTDGLRRDVEDGFGRDKYGDDRFDALVGLFGMLDVVLGNRPEGAPPDADIRRIEGWILGQRPV